MISGEAFCHCFYVDLGFFTRPLASYAVSTGFTGEMLKPRRKHWRVESTALWYPTKFIWSSLDSSSNSFQSARLTSPLSLPARTVWDVLSCSLLTSHHTRIPLLLDVTHCLVHLSSWLGRLLNASTIHQPVSHISSQPVGSSWLFSQLTSLALILLPNQLDLAVTHSCICPPHAHSGRHGSVGFQSPVTLSVEFCFFLSLGLVCPVFSLFHLQDSPTGI